MTLINFTKMQGLGNDFVILDYIEYEKTSLQKDELAIKLCDRHFGIGADGLIIVNPYTKNTDIGWFFYNMDGSIAQMCGNGIRCFAKYVHDNGFVNKKEFTVETKAGVIIPKILDDGMVKVNMGLPILLPEKIPANVQTNLNFDIITKDKTFKANAISMGNPHCVIFVNSLDTKQLALEYGSDIEVNKIFPEKTNVEFVRVVSRKEIVVDVWERGCGITLACGTGACASVVAGILNGLLDNQVKVNLPGGELFIEWNGLNESVFMTGNATLSFTGTYDLK